MKFFIKGAFVFFVKPEWIFFFLNPAFMFHKERKPYEFERACA